MHGLPQRALNMMGEEMAQNTRNLLEGIKDGLEKQKQQELQDNSVTIHYYHCDHLGTPIALTDQQGQLVWAARYDPWGNIEEEFNPHGIHQDIRLPGQHHDRETGLYYNRHRYYDPKLGAYINQDPIGLRGGLNLHAYVKNPTGWIDPFGLCQCDKIASTAKKNEGSEEWNYPQLANTCNYGVYDNIKEAGGPAPDRYPIIPGSYPIGAGKGGWGDPNASIPGWEQVSTPMPGDVAAGDGGTGYPHVGIVVERESGNLGTMGVSSADGTWKESGWPFRKNDKGAIYWRCTCK